MLRTHHVVTVKNRGNSHDNSLENSQNTNHKWHVEDSDDYLNIGTRFFRSQPKNCKYSFKRHHVVTNMLDTNR